MAPSSAQLSEDSSRAASLAKSLASKFLENGNYEALGSPLSRESADNYTQATTSGRLEEYFGGDEGFTGLAVHSVGYTSGASDEKVIIYVTRGSRKALAGIAPSVDGVKVEAKMMGRLKASPGPAFAAHGMSNFYEIGSRIACGSSCAPSGENYAGTLGCLIREGNNLLALSNNHVFASCNHTPIGMPILSPSTSDARPGRRAPSEICRHHGIVELRSGDPMLVRTMTLDAAVGLVVDPNAVSSWQGNALDGYDTPASTMGPYSGLRVKKVGRTTGLTYGTIESLVPTPWILPYKSGKFNSTVWFQDTWTVRSDSAEPFALPGDSGSLIVTSDGAAVVGLLFAANSTGQYGIIMPIDAVLSAFGNATVVSGHGIT